MLASHILTILNQEQKFSFPGYYKTLSLQWRKKNSNKKARIPKKAKEKYHVRKFLNHNLGLSKRANNSKVKIVKEIKEKYYAKKLLIYKSLYAKIT